MENARRGLIGIYGIKCDATSKSFVGGSVSIANKILKHIASLNKGVHENVSLQSEWNVFGPTAFSFSILELTSNKYHLSSHLRSWVSKIPNCEIIDDNANINDKRTLRIKTGIGVNADVKKNLKSLQLGTMDESIHHLIEFYNTIRAHE
ncbi:hypothetical protein A2881_01470 [Candidatus Peribacteria bacterium RIFCSPHIGHO2_01_FULL_55_13]|nr:MAG: hypothetical protein A2881_01470 [Candidatus Peribacteria bacterium RIFCSPHIGHO2_01_FULL_55_13]OGJ64889.1 MAG: hypothetical protein A3F36_01965 [Candidatus Peribacteria bacterium RIFCSPHIGHO2_12_FULL_55_11]